MAGRGASQAGKNSDTAVRAGTGDTQRLEAQIEAARDQLATTIDAIAGKVAPQNVAAKAKERARDVVVNPDGSLKKDRVVKIASVAAVVLAIGLWRRFR